MNPVAYRVACFNTRVLDRVAIWLPRCVLRWWLLRYPIGIETHRRFNVGEIDLDRFDLTLDREAILIRAYNRIPKP